MASTDDIELDIGDTTFTENDNNSIGVSNDSKVAEEASPVVLVNDGHGEDEVPAVASKGSLEVVSNVEEVTPDENEIHLEFSSDQKPEDDSKVEVKITFDGEGKESAEVHPNGDGATEMDMKPPQVAAATEMDMKPPQVAAVDGDEEFDVTVKQKPADEDDGEFDVTVKQKPADVDEDEEFDVIVKQKPADVDEDEEFDVIVKQKPADDDEEFDFSLKQKPADENDGEFDFTVKQKPADVDEDEEFDVTVKQKPADEDDEEFDFSLKQKPADEDDGEFDFTVKQKPADEDDGEFDVSVKQKPADNDEEFDFTLKQKPADEDDGEFDFTLKQKSPEIEPGEGTAEAEVVPSPPEAEGAHLEDATGDAADASVTPGEASTVVNEASAAAEDEWEHVKTVHLDSDKDSVDSEAHTVEIVGSGESFDYLTTVEGVPTLYRNEVMTTVKRGKLRSFFHWITTQKLRQLHLEDRNAIFCLAKHPYSSGDQRHFQMAASVYMALTGTRMSCPKFGCHWESVGFQGNDPGTDFRGTGMLGLLCLVHLCCDGCLAEDEAARQRQQMRNDLYRLARDAEQNFPLALMSINWTRICLQVLREGLLNKLFNRVCAQTGASMWRSFLELHSALAFRFATVWRVGHKTIADSGAVLNNLEALVRHKNEALFSEWQHYLAGGTQVNGSTEGPVATAGPGCGQIEFSKLD